MKRWSAKIDLPEGWVNEINHWRRDEGLSLQDLAARITEAEDLDPPLSHSTLSRVLRGEPCTLAVAEAIAEVSGITLPVTTDSPVLDEWLDLGRRLQIANERLLIQLIQDVGSIVDGAERLQKRRMK